MLYAVARSGQPAPPDTETLSAGQVSVIHRSVEREPGRSRPDLLAFADVLEEASRRGPVLPVRYGTTVSSRVDLCALATRNEDAWVARLDAVAGHCELVLHVRTEASGTPEVARTSGRDYLLARAEILRARAAVEEKVARLVRPWAREHQFLSEHDSTRLAVLVPRAATGEVRAAVAEWAASEGVEVRLTGPWPPFSFCGELAE